MTKKRQPVRTRHTDHHIENEDLRSFMLPLYITRIHSMRFIDTNVVIKLSLTAKAVYGYLCGIGYSCGYNSIYPNIANIADHLATNEKTIRNAIKTLEQTKLIKVVKVKLQGRFDSNHYWVYRPNMVDRVEWLDNNGNIMKGKHYNFNYKQFHNKPSNRVDKLLAGLLENVNNNK